MSLGVLNNLSAVYAENNLNNTNASLNTVLQQLSSGSKITSGADDAAGLSLVNGLQANQQALNQSKTNASEGEGLLQVADGALSQVTSLLNRAVTLATEAANGTLNATQDTAANQEYQSILSEINNIGSTTTYNQNQVFNSSTAIYTGDSTAAGASIDQLNIRSLSSTNLGDTGGQMAYSNGTNNVFLDLSSGGNNAGLTDSFGAAGTSTTIAVNYMTKGANGSAIEASANVTAGAGTSYSNTVQGLISAINGSGLGLTASFGTAAQAGSNAVSAAAGAETTTGSSGLDTGIIISGAGIGVGAAAAGANGGVGEIGTLNVAAAGDALSGTLNVVGSDGKTHAITLGAANLTDNITNLAATVNGDNLGVTATVNGTALTFTTANSAVTVSGAGIKDIAAADNIVGIPTGAGTQQATNLGDVTDTNTKVLAFGTASAEGTYTLTGGVAADIKAINAGKYGVTATLDNAGTGIELYTANSNETLGAATTAVVAAAAAPKTASQYYSVGISSAAAIQDQSTTGGTANTAFVQDTNGSNGVATISYSDVAGQSLSSTDLSNAGDAQAALTDLNAAIADVAAQDGYIGAQINTLGSVSQVLSTQQENVQSAQNAVQATDYASASSNMSKYEILGQTGIAALAQANSQQQEVLKLLQ
jgi:flagellin